jgi:hypothetical protein
MVRTATVLGFLSARSSQKLGMQKNADGQMPNYRHLPVGRQEVRASPSLRTLNDGAATLQQW